MLIFILQSASKRWLITKWRLYIFRRFSHISFIAYLYFHLFFFLLPFLIFRLLTFSFLLLLFCFLVAFFLSFLFFLLKEARAIIMDYLTLSVRRVLLTSARTQCCIKQYKWKGHKHPPSISLL